MNTYYIPWSAYGLATLRANSEEEAREIAGRALFKFSDFDFDTNNVDGIEYDATTDEP